MQPKLFYNKTDIEDEKLKSFLHGLWLGIPAGAIGLFSSIIIADQMGWLDMLINWLESAPVK